MVNIITFDQKTSFFRNGVKTSIPKTNIKSEDKKIYDFSVILVVSVFSIFNVVNVNEVHEVNLVLGSVFEVEPKSLLSNHVIIIVLISFRAFIEDRAVCVDFIQDSN